MNNFNIFQDSQGNAIQACDSYSSAFTPIPNNTVVDAYVESAQWTNVDPVFAENYGYAEKVITIVWKIAGGEYNNRTIYHRVQVLHPEAKKSDRARRMLSAIDGNTQAGIFANNDCSDERLLGICNKVMQIQIGLMNGKNFVASIGLANVPTKPVEQPVKVTPTNLRPMEQAQPVVPARPVVPQRAADQISEMASNAPQQAPQPIVNTFVGTDDIDL